MRALEHGGPPTMPRVQVARTELWAETWAELCGGRPCTTPDVWKASETANRGAGVGQEWCFRYRGPGGQRRTLVLPRYAKKSADGGNMRAAREGVIRQY